MAGADGDALVLGERHPLLRVHDEPYARRIPRQRRVVVLVDVEDQLQPWTQHGRSVAHARTGSVR